MSGLNVLSHVVQVVYGKITISAQEVVVLIEINYDLRVRVHCEYGGFHVAQKELRMLSLMVLLLLTHELFLVDFGRAGLFLGLGSALAAVVSGARGYW